MSDLGKKLDDSLFWIHEYLKHMAPGQQYDPAQAEKDRNIAIDELLFCKGIAATLSTPSTTGCICPATAEQTCRAPLCPRKGISLAGGAHEPIIKLCDA